ncbi:uncharacterized protein LOC129234190 isoform X2 [Uloborus diversus]|uniref:uncharacterized protein LOC129234190 isoform X2 n=1 Tax=Uloborus diversus TaxID=327109 RepID=UPI00240A595A|nr:uncharacterized protein LOC129234190 isoform X2 [Uloborus diversus]
MNTVEDLVGVPECNPPDFPQWGNYGPRQDFYVPGDVIHYYCDTETYIGGNFYRRCEDTGDWTGDTPVCDTPTKFSSTSQDDAAEGTADRAVDGLRSTCTGEGSSWCGTFTTPGELFRVMLFLPKVEVTYEVFMVKTNGTELSCGTKRGRIERLDWEFHNCPGPHNRDIVGIKIKALDSVPLKICEVQAYVLTSPTCTDPHLIVENGRFQLSRKHASLVCDTGYTRSPTARVDCVRDGVWNRKNLYCLERQWELDQNEGGGSERNREPLQSQNNNRREV